MGKGKGKRKHHRIDRILTILTLITAVLEFLDVVLETIARFK